MTINASTIMADGAKLLNDDAFDNWSEDELFTWISEGQQVIVLLSPDAYVVSSAVKLVEGILQTVSGVQLIKVPYNMGINGVSPGSPIDMVDMDEFSRMNPGWTADPPSATVEKVMFNEDDPAHFYVYPPQPESGQGYVQQVRAVCPDKLVKNDVSPYYQVPLVLDDIYESVLLNYMLFKAYSKDAAVTQYAAERSVAYFNMVANALGRKDLAQKAYNPNRTGSVKGSE